MVTQVIQLYTDEDDLVLDDLEEIGPGQILPLRMAGGIPPTPWNNRFVLALNPRAGGYVHGWTSWLRRAIEDFMVSYGVDLALYPLQTEMRLSREKPTLVLPIAAMRARKLEPYGRGPFAHLRLLVTSDDPNRTERLLYQDLATQGWRELVFGKAGPHHPVGHQIVWPLVAPTIPERRQVEDLAQRVVGLPDPSAGYRFHSYWDHADDSPGQVWLHLTTGVPAGEELVKSIEKSRGKQVIMIEEPSPEAGLSPFGPTLAMRLRALGYATNLGPPTHVRESRGPALSGRVALEKAGLAPDLVGEVQQELERCYGEPLPLRHGETSEARQIKLHLPRRTKHLPVDPLLLRIHAMIQNHYFAKRALVDAPWFMEIEAAGLRIGDLVLPRFPGAKPSAIGTVPQIDLCLDRQATKALVHLAESFALARPALLTGATSVGKTALVEFLADLLGAPLERIVLRPDITSDDLIGRYVPDGIGGLCWQQGPVLRALNQGGILFLDECNLAPSEHLERLNGLLETPPRFHAYERAGEDYGPGKKPIHPAFRIVCARNPAGYAGRMVLSRAFRNRFADELWLEEPREPELRDMLLFLISGRQPALEAKGHRYRMPLQTVNQSLQSLLAYPDSLKIMFALARFHSGITEAMRNGYDDADDGGGCSDEPPTFTRRNLRMTLEYVAWELTRSRPHWQDRPELQGVVVGALERHYLGSLQGKRRNALISLMDACGIGPNVWKRPA